MVFILVTQLSLAKVESYIIYVHKIINHNNVIILFLSKFKKINILIYMITLCFIVFDSFVVRMLCTSLKHARTN